MPKMSKVPKVPNRIWDLGFRISDVNKENFRFQIFDFEFRIEAAK